MTWRIPLVKPFLPSVDEILGDVRQMLDSGRLTNFGPFAERLEREAEVYLGVGYAASVSSATTGLSLLLNTLPEGSEVIVPSFTFVATAQAIAANRLIPVFADIDPGTLNVCPHSVEERITPRTSAVLAVTAFGAPCDIEELERVARRHHIALFFDSAHAFGASYQGRRLAGFGQAEVFSLSATKVLPCGEGGLVATNDAQLYESILNRRNYGLTHGGRDCAHMGANGKMMEFPAILGLKGIEHMDRCVDRRNQIAQSYIDRLQGIPGLGFQVVRSGNVSTYKDFTVQVDEEVFGAGRNAVRADLANRGIEAAPYFWPAIHSMTYFSRFATGPLRHTERVTNSILSLPIYETITGEEIDAVAGVIEQMSRVRV